jgi:hypothetical protein
MGKFDEILKRAAGFVDRQKGRWDNAEWLGFLADVRQKGTGLSKEAEDYLGQVLESMKRFYRSNGQTRGKGISEGLNGVSEQAAKFVHQSRGIWDHAAWEKFLRNVQKTGVKLSGETTTYVGEILEASKRIYEALPTAGGAAPAKTAAAPAKTAAAPKRTTAAPKTAAPKQRAPGGNGAQKTRGGLAKTPTRGGGAKSSSAKRGGSSTTARVVTAPAKKSNGKPTSSSRSSRSSSSASKKSRRKSR